MKNIEKLLALGFLFFAIGFNLWLYRLEPTAKVDPNDNSFQFALVDRTNTMWDFAERKCQGFWLSAVSCKLSYLTDHWVPNWAEGYNLPYYYSHLPQIAIVGSYRIFHSFSCKLSAVSCQLSLFIYYHYIIYLLLCFFPLSVFLALRVIGFPWIISGIGAFTASQLSTDGLYGLDPSSFLWRGFGLSSQLFAMIWLPLAIAYSWRYLTVLRDRYLVLSNKIPLILNTYHFTQDFILAVLFLVLTTAGHLGIGIMAILGLIPLAFGSLVLPLIQNIMDRSIQKIKDQITQEFFPRTFLFILLVGSVVLLLSYWIVPVLLHDLYHNTSVWDPVWKFDSYGAKDVLTKLLAGDLFDFGRFPILTILTTIGIIGALSGKIFADYNKQNYPLPTTHYPPNSSYPLLPTPYSLSTFPFLFLFYLLLYFGRTTWGPLIDLIPGMSDFHISRFIVGLHIAGIFLVPIGIQTIVSSIKGLVLRGKQLPLILNTFPLILNVFVYLFIGLFVYWIITPQTIEYARHNDRLIKQANENYAKIADDTEELLKTLKALPPSRIYAGRGGNWGKQFRVAETPMFMHISTYGIPTVLWLPETWSPSSDTEQFFSEDRMEDYVLYNLRYVVAPFDKEPLPFWKPLKEGKTWKLYTVESGVTGQGSGHTDNASRVTQNDTGYITTGYGVASVASDKFSFVNVIRLWIVSNYPKLGLYPRINLQKKPLESSAIPPTLKATDGHSSYQLSASHLPYFTMLDEATYITPDGKTHSLFLEPPVYSVNPTVIEKDVDTQTYGIVKILAQSSDTDMIFKATVEVSDKCTTCLVILRQTYHPSWVATVDGKRVESFSIFPFFTAIKVSPGTHDIVFSYEPSLLKKLLFPLFIGGMFTLLACIFRLKMRR
ncbi:hypothetical protein HY947_01870 [Candidatus Gottesmanbacteria bacterium]|nr:hypothetical protein [Candidatus Gottesmanbacteria bacterium]